jgi:hypothetical protein
MGNGGIRAELVIIFFDTIDPILPSTFCTNVPCYKIFGYKIEPLKKLNPAGIMITLGAGNSPAVHPLKGACQEKILTRLQEREVFFFQDTNLIELP